MAGPLGALARAAMDLAEQMIAEQSDEPPHQNEAILDVLHAFDLHESERDALVLAVLCETDWRFGRAIAYAQDNPQLTRPTVGLALLLSDTKRSVFRLTDGPLIRDGLIALEGSGPLASRVLVPTPNVAARLCGESSRSTDVIEPDPGLLATLVLDDATRRAIERWASSPTRPLVIAGPPGSGRRTLARAAAGRANVRLVSTDLRCGGNSPLIARRDARWNHAALSLICEGLERAHWSALWATAKLPTTPVIVIVPESDVEPALGECSVQPVIVHLGSWDPELRRTLWRTTIPPSVDDSAVDALATRFAFTPAKIARVIDATRAETLGVLTPAALIHNARTLGRSQMSGLGQRLPLPFTRADLIVTDRVHAELDLAHAWVHHRQQVQVTWGMGRRIGRGRGLTALFAGEPGTGKTMAAQVLAHELDLDLFAIDLSRVLSKYIGETEKNLAKLFDEARESGAMLFFDEGDALFGKRTETRDAHDRYANVEIAYLLQRMEQHEGVTVLATNRLRDIDEAFVRRFHVIADFALPEAADRLQIWNRMLAPPVVCDGDLRLSVIAREFPLSGGQIRNIVLSAAHFAAVDGMSVGWRHLERALRREMRHQGRVFDERISRVLSAGNRS